MQTANDLKSEWDDQWGTVGKKFSNRWKFIQEVSTSQTFTKDAHEMCDHKKSGPDFALLFNLF